MNKLESYTQAVDGLLHLFLGTCAWLTQRSPTINSPSGSTLEELGFSNSCQCPGSFLGFIAQNSSYCSQLQPVTYILWSSGLSLIMWGTYYRFLSNDWLFSWSRELNRSILNSSGSCGSSSRFSPCMDSCGVRLACHGRWRETYFKTQNVWEEEEDDAGTSFYATTAYNTKAHQCFSTHKKQGHDACMLMTFPSSSLSLCACVVITSLPYHALALLSQTQLQRARALEVVTDTVTFPSSFSRLKLKEQNY